MNKQILVVDDDDSITSIFDFILQQAGYSVLTTNTGTSCISMLTQNPTIDLVFLDVKMPGISGLETLKELLKINPNLLVLLMTGHSIEEVLNSAYEIGAYGVIYKPFDVEELLNIINNIFKIHENTK